MKKEILASESLVARYIKRVEKATNEKLKEKLDATAAVSFYDEVAIEALVEQELDEILNGIIYKKLGIKTALGRDTLESGSVLADAIGAAAKKLAPTILNRFIETERKKYEQNLPPKTRAKLVASYREALEDELSQRAADLGKAHAGEIAEAALKKVMKPK